MIKINYDEFTKQKKDKFFKVPALLGRKRAAKRRPRNPEERDALMLLDYQRYLQWLKNGDLIEVSNRKYIVAKLYK